MGELEVLSSSQVRLLDENSMALGISPLQLMEAAGKSVADFIASKMDMKGKRAVVVCGTGNNGGDGFVTARYLASMGSHVTVILLGRESDIRTEEARRNWSILKGLRLTVKLYEAPDEEHLMRIKDLILGADIIVDAIFGIGFKGMARPPHSTAIRLMNQSKGFKVAVDIPSGLEADTAEVHGEAFKAHATITFQAVKPSLLKVKEYVGELIVARIGIPIEAMYLVGLSDVRRCFKKRDIFAKKGDHGRVVIVGGSVNYTGAPALAAFAALKMGVDLALILTPKEAVAPIRAYSPDLIVTPLSSRENLSLSDVPLVLSACERADALIIGPGLGLHEETVRSVREIVAKVEVPMIIDADALKALSGYLDLIKGKRAVLTPHSKEFEILTGIPFPPPEDLQGRLRVAKDVAKEYALTFLVKGREDVITDGRRVKVNMTGNALMTVGGTGDVLTGIIAALIANGIAPFEAACAGAFINGLAGDIVASHKVFITARTLIEFIQDAVKLILKDFQVVERSQVFNALFSKGGS